MTTTHRAGNVCVPNTSWTVFGKLVEKVVAHLFYKEMDLHGPIPTTQFGDRRALSTLDAALMLTHDVKVMHVAGLHMGILLFDIAGIFDNVNRPQLAQLPVVDDLGFAPELVSWT